MWLLWLLRRRRRNFEKFTTAAIADRTRNCSTTRNSHRHQSILSNAQRPLDICCDPRITTDLAAALEGKHRISTGNMSLVNLAHVCSHLQNASKARLGLTSIPVSKMHVNLVLGLQREGFLSSVTLGGVSPPKPFLLQTQADPEEMENLAEKLKAEPWQAFNVSHSLHKHRVADLGKEKVEHVSVPQNPARRRLWLGLKYWNNEPVLKNMKLISKPTRRIWLTSQDLGKITRTRESSYVKGLTHPGECMFLTTDRGILEARECVERQLGGMALCRVW
jgi:ribosomal protein S8